MKSKNKGRCEKCCFSQRKNVFANKFVLFDWHILESLGVKKWLYCTKHKKFCRNIAFKCKAPSDGFKLN